MWLIRLLDSEWPQLSAQWLTMTPWIDALRQYGFWIVRIQDGKARPTFPDRASEQQDQLDQNEFDIFDLQEGMTHTTWAVERHTWTHTTVFRVKVVDVSVILNLYLPVIAELPVICQTEGVA